jgi:acyl-CoA thioester hydrolase
MDHEPSAGQFLQGAAMSLTHMQTFRIRSYECNAHGFLHPASYLHYMQETASDATAAAGYDMARYEAMGRLWLARQTNIRYRRPLRYGDSVQVKTWVTDFRRIRSRRAYEFALAGSGDLVARAQTDWVFLDRDRGRPAPIPMKMKAAFFPEGLPTTTPAASRFPSPPQPPPDAFQQWRRVEWQDLDQAQHVNNAVYLAYIDDCEVQAAAARGWSPERLQMEGFTIVPTQHQIEYRQAAILNDELALTTWISSANYATALRHFVISRAADASPVVRAHASWMCVDLRTGRQIPIPEALLADLAPRAAAP